MCGGLSGPPAAAPKQEKAEGKKPTRGPRWIETASSKTNKPPDKKQQLRDLFKARIATSPLEGRGVLAAPDSVLIRNATIWTCADKRVLTNSNLLLSPRKLETARNFKTQPRPH